MYRISKLLSTGRKLFHTADLAVAWGIVDKNTLYTTIKRYVAKNILFPIHKGFYSLVPINDLDPYTLGISFLHRYAYISTETVLEKEGLIFQKIYPLTLVSDISKRFTINSQAYLVRQMADKRLYSSEGLESKNGVMWANKKRAISDMLYFNPKYHLDRKI